MRALAAVAFALAFVTTLTEADARAASEPLPRTELARDLPRLPPLTLKTPEPPPELLSEAHGFFRLVYHPSLDALALRLARESESMRAELVAMVGVDALDRIELRVARTHQEMALLSPREAPPSESSRGVAYPPLRLVVVERIEGDDAATIDVLRHELAHLALFDATAEGRVPRWFEEGFAIHAAGADSFSRARTLWSAQVDASMLPLSQLDAIPDDGAHVSLASAESGDFVRFLSSHGDGARFVAFLSRVRDGDPFDRALVASYGAGGVELERRWRADASARYLTTPLLFVTGTLSAVLVTAAIVSMRRRRRRRDQALDRAAMHDARSEALRAAVDRADAEHASTKLLVVEEGVGHVVYLERARVPTVEHDGKVHTLH